MYFRSEVIVVLNLAVTTDGTDVENGYWTLGRVNQPNPMVNMVSRKITTVTKMDQICNNDYLYVLIYLSCLQMPCCAW